MTLTINGRRYEVWTAIRYRAASTTCATARPRRDSIAPAGSPWSRRRSRCGATVYLGRPVTLRTAGIMRLRHAARALATGWQRIKPHRRLSTGCGHRQWRGRVPFGSHRPWRPSGRGLIRQSAPPTVPQDGPERCQRVAQPDRPRGARAGQLLSVSGENPQEREARPGARHPQNLSTWWKPARSRPGWVTPPAVVRSPSASRVTTGRFRSYRSWCRGRGRACGGPRPPAFPARARA